MLSFTGLSHRIAPLALRERCAVPSAERARALEELRRRHGHVALLSTCGRTELYLDAPDPEAAEYAALEWLARRGNLNAGELAPYIETARGVDAVQRIVRVACGLESVVQGEDEILGQVRRAWLDAGATGALSPALDSAFRTAVSTGRRARRTGDRHAWTSLADSAAAHLTASLDSMPAPRVLIAGTGPMGLRTAAALRERLGRRMVLDLAGRTPGRVRTHAAALHARPLDLASIPDALARADAAIIALRTSRAIFGTEEIEARPADRPLVLIDLSVPRAVDGAVAALAGVRLLDVDTLAGGEGAYSRWDASSREQVEEMVARAVHDWSARTEQTDADATLTALRVRADGIRRRQVDLTLRRLPHLDGEARWMIEALSHAIVNKLLHEPTHRLKGDQDGHTAQQIRALFGMEGA